MHKARKERTEFPNGEVKDVQINRVVKEPLLLKFAGLGMPRGRNGQEDENGDLFVVIDPIAKNCRVRRFASHLYRKLKSCLTGVEEN